MTALLTSALARQKYSGSLSKSAVTKLTKAKHLTPKYSKEHLSVLRYILFISTTESQSVQSWKGPTNNRGEDKAIRTRSKNLLKRAYCVSQNYSLKPYGAVTETVLRFYKFSAVCLKHAHEPLLSIHYL